MVYLTSEVPISPFVGLYLNVIVNLCQEFTSRYVSILMKCLFNMELMNGSMKVGM